MKRYFMYCRKSTEDKRRQILSIESQIDELKCLAEKQGLSVVEVFEETQSAKQPGRPVFNEMIKRIYQGEAAGILCWKLDRLARNPVDGGAMIWAVTHHGLEIVTPTYTYRDSHDNTILMYFEFGMAHKYIDDLVSGVKRGIRKKTAKGWRPGVAAIGYLNNKHKDLGEKDIRPDPDRFKRVRQMWDLMLTGLYTPPQIMRIANEEWEFRTRKTQRQGGKPLSKSMIYHIFTNTFYYGTYEYPVGSGEWHKGKHKPLITEAEFDRVQTLLGRYQKPRPRERIFPFTGLIRCGECTSMVTAEKKEQIICSACRYKFSYINKQACPKCQTGIEDMSNPTILDYTYYHCTKKKTPQCTQKGIEVKKLEKQIDAELAHLEISPRFRDWALQRLQDFNMQKIEARQDILKTQQRAYKQCVQKIENLVTLKTSPDNTDGSQLSDEEYKKQRKALLKEKARLEEHLQDTGQEIEQWVKTTEMVFTFACSARSWFAKGDPQTKKEILFILGSNLVLKDKKLSITTKKPFLILKKSLSRMPTEKDRFEPRKSVVNKGQKGPAHPLSPSVLPDTDEVRTSKYGGQLNWEALLQEIFTHLMQCEEECVFLHQQLLNLEKMRRNL